MQRLVFETKTTALGRTWLPGNVYEVCDDPKCPELDGKEGDEALPEAVQLQKLGAKTTKLPVGAIVKGGK